MDGKMKSELNDMSLEELYNLLIKVDELKDIAKKKIIEVKKDESTSSTKRGTRS